MRFVHLDTSAAIMYASSAGVDCFIIPAGETRINFSRSLAGWDESIIPQQICPPNEEPIMLEGFEFQILQKIFPKKL